MDSLGWDIFDVRRCHGPQANSAQDIAAHLHRLPRNISLQLTPNVRLWFDGGLFAGVRFALVIRRGN